MFSLSAASFLSTASLLFITVGAMPAVNAPRYITTTTLYDSRCVDWITGTATSTLTVPGSTFTATNDGLTTVTSTSYAFPTPTAAAVEKREGTTIVYSQICLHTSTTDPWVTTADPAVVTTTTAYATTETHTETYTLCVEGHSCL